MLKFLKFTGNTTDTDLLSTSSKTTNDSSIIVNRILITNTHDSNELTVDRLYIDDTTNEYDIIANVKIPVGASLLLDEDIVSTGIDFIKQKNKFQLKLTTTGGANCALIIK